MVVADVQFYASFVSCGFTTKENRLPECTTEVIKTDGKILLLPRNFLNPEVSLEIVSFIHKQINLLFRGRSFTKRNTFM